MLNRQVIVFKYFFLLLIGVPVLEIYLMIQVGRAIGAWPTIGLLVFSAVSGILLLKSQGIATLHRVMQSLQQGQLPAIALLEGLILAIAGVLLIIPGFFTDAIALIFLIPPARRALARQMISTFTVRYTGIDPFQRPPGPKRDPGVIEGEFRRED